MTSFQRWSHMTLLSSTDDSGSRMSGEKRGVSFQNGTSFPFLLWRLVSKKAVISLPLTRLKSHRRAQQVEVRADDRGACVEKLYIPDHPGKILWPLSLSAIPTALAPAFRSHPTSISKEKKRKASKSIHVAHRYLRNSILPTFNALNCK